MIDSDADMNCIQEGLIPSKYFEKSTERLVSANGSQMNAETVEFCKKEISDLLEKKLIRNSKSPCLVLLFMSRKMLRLKEELLD